MTTRTYSSHSATNKSIKVRCAWCWLSWGEWVELNLVKFCWDGLGKLRWAYLGWVGWSLFWSWVGLGRVEFILELSRVVSVKLSLYWFWLIWVEPSLDEFGWVCWVDSCGGWLSWVEHVEQNWSCFGSGWVELSQFQLGEEFYFHCLVLGLGWGLDQRWWVTPCSWILSNPRFEWSLCSKYRFPPLRFPRVWLCGGRMCGIWGSWGGRG